MVAPRNPPEALGLVCPKCECRHFETTHTERLDGRIRRRRVCRHCGHKLTTFEMTVPDLHRNRP